MLGEIEVIYNTEYIHMHTFTYMYTYAYFFKLKPLFSKNILFLIGKHAKTLLRAKEKRNSRQCSNSSPVPRIADF